MDTLNVVKEAYGSFQKGDIPSVLAKMGRDVDWYLPGDQKLMAVAGRRKGPEGVAEFFSTLASTQDVLQFEPRDFVASGDKVVALGEYKWRVKATGKEFSSEFAHVFTVRDGKIVGFHEYYDTAAAGDAYR